MAVVRCDGLVMRSIAGITNYDSDGHGNVTSVRNAAGRIPWTTQAFMLALVPNERPVAIWPQQQMSRKKYVVAGTLLPVEFDPAQRQYSRILWTGVPPLDDWIAQGVEVFSNPDAARARLEWAHYTASGQHLPPGNADATFNAGDVPARILAVSPGQIRYEILLSVAVPGRPRFGYRWHGRRDKKRFLPEWGDIPVRVDAKGKVDILWDQLALRETKTMERAALAQVERIYWAPVPQVQANNPHEAMLCALQQRHAAGLMSDEQYAAARARVIAGL